MSKGLNVNSPNVILAQMSMGLSVSSPNVYSGPNIWPKCHSGPNEIQPITVVEVYYISDKIQQFFHQYVAEYITSTAL